jgi:hypothetical protein
MANQQRLDATAEKILGAKDRKFAGIVVAAESNQLKIYWKGGHPSKIAAKVIEEAQQSASIQVYDAKYSLAELQAEATKVASAGGVTAVSPNADGSGLSVSMKPGLRSAPITPKVPITQIDNAEPQGAYSRGDDSAPYWGGARWSTVSGGCSTGFAIRIAGVSRMLSAGHCASNGQVASDGGGQVMGTVGGDSNAYDRLYINTSSAGRIYDGGVGVGEFSKPVVGAAHSFVGNWLCTSGGYSGARCNEQVTAVNQTINVGYLIYQTVRAEQVNHTNAVGNGDSGGPVFALAANPNTVIAKGTVTAIDLSTQVACTGLPATATRHCAWRFYYVDVVNSLNAYGAQIVTG